jgi:N,N'-diacetyllegionaminate synthase
VNQLLQENRNVLIIAEIGVNHDGNSIQASDLITAAKRAGADAVKVQLFQADRLMHASAAFAEYQRRATGAASAAEMLRKYELADATVRQLAREARALGLIFLATPFSPDDLSLIEELDLPAVKIASPDLVNKPLLHRAAESHRPLLVSTGAATMEEVAEAVAWLRQWKTEFALLHCVSSYPVPAAEANLCWIGELRQRFGVIVGYSDHTTDVAAGALAVAAGARLVEKHLTLDRAAEGPDHAASFDEEQFAEYVRLIRSAETLLGSPGKRVLPIEADVRQVSRQSLVLARAVAAGARIQPDDLTVQRPGTGVPAGQIDRFAGRCAARALRPGEMAAWDMVA